MLRTQELLDPWDLLSWQLEHPHSDYLTLESQQYDLYFLQFFQTGTENMEGS